jgi:hypothetical protein
MADEAPEDRGEQTRQILAGIAGYLFESIPQSRVEVVADRDAHSGSAILRLWRPGIGRPLAVLVTTTLLDETYADALAAVRGSGAIAALLAAAEGTVIELRTDGFRFRGGR